MVSLASRLVPPVLAAQGRKRRYVNRQATLDQVLEDRLRPKPYGPPRRLPRDVRISVRDDHGWPVYDVVGEGDRPKGHALYLHGGAWINEITSHHWRLIALLASTAGIRIVVPIYPLAPHGTAVTVVPRAAGLLRGLVAEHGAGQVSVIGDSAGGQIALSAGLLLREEGIALRRTVLISPALDLRLDNPEIDAVEPRDPWLARPGIRGAIDLWRADLPLDDPRVSPLLADLAGLGPLAVFSGTVDITYPDVRLLVSRARAAGVEVDFHEAQGMVHVYPLLPIPEGRAARTAMAALLRS
ncbi:MULTISPECIES: alpha/beta hydrolase fold domain-containing protein [unclassified Streptomyces]|uniref:Steryl acetyl hydrolase n=1 Tax=Streptomyces sp. gb1(2016) TaxID=1828321 RepID=A0A652L6M9_9ACTN|nr:MULTISPECIES: alpha/beta hydrolase [unclassified Streptomyces]MDX3683568.1 alpha/beta hydrolase [Streptomyces sp. AK04-4c]TXS31511.1 steryl acetyl hydrolase [Streptomyces sp. gb1(2016)]WSS64771.1 alpha/beta hydrolase [Streptomyces sp. NBC_01177]WSS78777.1 alpha/beta hydrolase [Streptomyces sp. NBC_01174]